MSSIFSQSVWTALMLVLIAGCKGDMGEHLQSGRVLALHGLQGRWAGPVVPQDKSCGPVAQGLMSIGEKGFAFDPFQSTTVIQGSVGKDGHLVGDLTRLGPDHQNLLVSFVGSAISESDTEMIEGALVSGRCHWKVTLHRA
jgi:hypothetical protein